MKETIQKELEQFNTKAKSILSTRNTSEKDGEVRDRLSDAFTYISNGMYMAGIECAEFVTSNLQNDELTQLLNEIKKNNK
jgi:hypothetical protein